MTSNRGCCALLGVATLATTAVTGPGLARPAAAVEPRQPAATSGEAAAAGRVALRERFAASLREIAAGVDGVVGYLVVDLASGERFAAHERVPFPTASTIKIAILYELYRQADEGRLALDTARPLPAVARAAGSGVLGDLRAPSLPLRDYATLMILVSDNSATNLLIDTVGMDRVNARMRALGVEGLALRRRMMDVDAARRGDENVATPAALARLLDVVRTGEGLGAASRAAVLETLQKPKATPITAGVPAGTPVAGKPGELEGVRVDAGLVLVPGRPYVLVMMCAWLRDDAEGERAIEAASRAAYAYFTRLAAGGDYGRLIPR